MTKSEFIESYGLTEAQFSGKEKIEGNLYLASITALPEGFNPTVGGDLYLGSLTSLPDGFNPTVGGNLYLGGLTSVPEGFNPIVGGGLHLGGLTSLPEGFNPTVVGFLYLSGLTSLPKGFNPTVGGNLYLGWLTSVPEGFNPTVGGFLCLSGLTSLPKGFNPTVGGDLYLNSLTSLPEGFHPIVGGFLYLSGLTAIPVDSPVPGLRMSRNFFWDKGNGLRYALIDGLLCQVLRERKMAAKEEGTYTIYSAKKIGKDKSFYIVNKGAFYAHGVDLKKAMEDLAFKIVAEKLKKEPIQPDTLITVGYYRTVTGACEFGCQQWLTQNNLEKLTEIKAFDLLPLLKKTQAWGLDKFAKLVTF